MQNFAYTRPATLNIGSGGVTNTKITDNVRAEPIVTDPSWIQLSNDTMIFVIDLGSIKLVKRGRLQLGRFSSSNVALPTLITYQVGDGVTYSSLGTLAPSGADNTANYYQIDNQSGISGRFVKVILTRSAGTNIYVGEIQAWDDITTVLLDLPELDNPYVGTSTIDNLQPFVTPNSYGVVINLSLVLAPLLAIGIPNNLYIPDKQIIQKQRQGSIAINYALVGITTFITETIVLENPNKVIAWTSDYNPETEMLIINAELEREGGLEVIILPEDADILSVVTREILVNKAIGYSINQTKSKLHQFNIPLKAGQGRIQIHLEVTSPRDD